MKLEKGGTYFMPVGFGQSPPHAAGVFDDVWTGVINYRSDKDLLAAFLPEPFQPADDPIVSVVYQRCLGVNILNGGGYNLMGVNLAAVFEGQRDHLAGAFCLILWENQTVPIIRGRELLGIPKIFADVSDPEKREDKWLVRVTDAERTLIEMDLAEGRELTDEEVRKLNRPRDDDHWFGWRYIPRVNGIGAALSEPQSIGIENTFVSAYEADGEIRYGAGKWDAHPGAQDILGGLRRLKIKEYLGGQIRQGSVAVTRAKHRVLV
jgi:acetoacetate decarboxylase